MRGEETPLDLKRAIAFTHFPNCAASSLELDALIHRLDLRDLIYGLSFDFFALNVITERYASTCN